MPRAAVGRATAGGGLPTCRLRVPGDEVENDQVLQRRHDEDRRLGEARDEHEKRRLIAGGIGPDHGSVKEPGNEPQTGDRAQEAQREDELDGHVVTVHVAAVEGRRQAVADEQLRGVEAPAEQRTLLDQVPCKRPYLGPAGERRQLAR
jgi:hypothetical protein